MAVIAAFFWFVQFFTLLIAPFILMIDHSFHGRDFNGGITDEWTIEAWKNLFSTHVLWVWIRSIFIALVNTMVCIIIGIPIALGIHSATIKIKKYIFIALLLPLGMNTLLIGYSWQVILGNKGLINSILIKYDIVSKPVALLYTPASIVIGLLGFYLTYFVLAFLTSLYHIDKGIVIASKSCGANDFQTLKKIILPLSKPGLIAGSLLVFLPSLAEYVIPSLLGGNKVFLIGNFTKYLFYEGRNWPLGSAMLTFTTVILTILVIPFIKHLRGVFSGYKND